MATVAIICPACGTFNGTAPAAGEPWKCGECDRPLQNAPQNKSARLNVYGYNAHPTLSRVLDSVTRTR